MSNHRWVTVLGWCTFCYRCRLMRLRNPESERRARGKCL